MLTVIDIKDGLWRKAKIIAVKGKTSLKYVVNEALAAYLQPKPKKSKED